MLALAIPLQALCEMPPRAPYILLNTGQTIPADHYFRMIMDHKSAQPDTRKCQSIKPELTVFECPL
jgi:hypothetical protein